MGMFDSISISDPLPANEEMVALGLDKRDWVLQTKDFSNAMDWYVLQDNQLYTKKYKVEKWIEGDKNGKSFMDKIGHLHREGEYLHPVDYTGEISMYDFRQDVQDKWDCWIEWNAIFENGKVKEIKLSEFTKTDNTDRKAREKKLFDEIREHREKWYNKYIFHTSVYCFFSGKLRWFLYKLGAWIQSLGRFF